MEINRQVVREQIEKMLAGCVSKEDIGWWAYEFLMEEKLQYEPGHEKLLEDVLRSLHYFHDIEPVMQQFYPATEEILYYLECLQGEVPYERSRVVHWRV